MELDHFNNMPLGDREDSKNPVKLGNSIISAFFF